MKKYTLSSLLFFLIACMTGCQNSSEFGDVVYLTGTLSQPVVRFTVDGPSSLGLTVTATDKVTTDQKASLKAAPELLTAYNEANGRSYEVPPADAYTLENGSVTIKSGDYISSQAKLSVDSEKLKKGIAYCLPVTISSSEGGFNVLESSRTAYIVLSQVITSKVANIQGMYYSVPSFKGSGAADVNALNQMTMECKIYVNAFQDGNPYISSVMGIEERFLFRFGDVSCDKDQLQLAGAAVGDNKKYPMTLDMHFATGRWYHLACVYNGKTVTMYVDGKVQSSVTTSGGKVDLSWDYMDGFHIGRSERGRYLNGWVSEARVWSIARTAAELEDGVCYVDPTTKGLVAYWNFDGTVQENGSIRDLTGHGHNAIPSSTPKWVENQKCPF